MRVLHPINHVAERVRTTGIGLLNGDSVAHSDPSRGGAAALALLAVQQGPKSKDNSACRDVQQARFRCLSR